MPERKVIVVATPRTASRALFAAVQAGVRRKEATVTSVHHDLPHDVARAASGGGYEVWAVIREPLSQLKSWISHVGHWGDPDKFIQTYSSRYFFYNEGMNIYNRETTRFFVYENNGPEELLRELNLANPVTLSVIGETGSKGKDLCPHQIALAKKRFAFDFALYDRIIGA